MVWPNWYQNIMQAAIVKTLNGVSYQIVGNTKELFGTLFMKVLKKKKKEEEEARGQDEKIPDQRPHENVLHLIKF